MPARPLPTTPGRASNLVPALLGPGGTAGLPDWTEPAHGARQVVLFVLDGLGWDQLLERSALAPTLAAMAGRPIDGRAHDHGHVADQHRHRSDPGEHGVVGTGWRCTARC